MAIPPMKKEMREIQPLTANCSEPLIPWPLGQPSAMRAPNIKMVPPKKAMIHRLKREGPKCLSHIGGTNFFLKSPESFEAIKAPIRIPRTSIHCQSMTGFSLTKYGRLGTRSAENVLSIIPMDRTKVLETPKYSPAVSTENQLTTPISAPAAYGDHSLLLRIFIISFSFG